jgi:short chain dehydrogenase
LQDNAQSANPPEDRPSRLAATTIVSFSAGLAGRPKILNPDARARRELAAEGAAVVVNYASSREGADRVVAEIKAKGGKAITVQGDVAKSADVKKIFAETRQAFGRLDILVNNAGI